MPTSKPYPGFQVETAWLAANLADPAVVTLDATTHLRPSPDRPYDVVSGRADFDQGHIPGARFANALRPEQHRGEGGTRYGRLGHITGSTNVAAADLVNADNTFKSPDELRHLLAGPLAAPKVITYCGGGIAASSTTLALTMLGHPEVRLYDASLTEWAPDPALPMATGN